MTADPDVISLNQSFPSSQLEMIKSDTALCVKKWDFQNANVTRHPTIFSLYIYLWVLWWQKEIYLVDKQLKEKS